MSRRTQRSGIEVSGTSPIQLLPLMWSVMLGIRDSPVDTVDIPNPGNVEQMLILNFWWVAKNS